MSDTNQLAKDQPSKDPQFQAIEQLMDNGQFLDAYNQAIQLWGETSSWRTVERRFLLARLLDSLGMPRRSIAIQLMIWRQNKTQSKVALSMVYYLLNYKGPVVAWSFIEQHQHLFENDKEKAAWSCAKSFVAVSFRDFEQAESYFSEAAALDEDQLWIKRTRGYLAVEQEDSATALNILKECYAQTPREELLLQLCSVMTNHQGYEEALVLLSAEVPKYQSCRLWNALAQYYRNHKSWAECEQALKMAMSYSVGEDKNIIQQYHMLKSAIAMGIQDYPTAKEHLAKVNNYYSNILKQNLEALRTDNTNVKLDVPHIRQKHLTCAPTSIAALTSFWGVEHDHDEIAEAICYGGTRETDERQWLIEQDFVYREFELNWDFARLLLDAGIPFSLVTNTGLTAHMQAVVGYDLASGILYIMDPSSVVTIEVLAAQLLEANAHNGPRCMAFVPQQKQQLLQQFDWPCNDLYVEHGQFMDALVANQLHQCQTHIDKLTAIDADHRLTLQAQYVLAGQLENHQISLEIGEKLLAKYPLQVSLFISRFHVKTLMGDANTALRELSERVDKNHEIDLIMLEFNRLYDVSSYKDRVVHLLSLIRRYCWADSEALCVQANRLWEQGQFEQATLFYRWALCLSDTQERYAESFYKASRHIGQQKQALAMLQNRFDKYGHKSAGPAISLYSALELQDLYHQGLQVLEQGFAMRDDDPFLIDFYLQKLLASGKFDAFEEIFERKSHLLDPQQKSQLQASFAYRNGDIESAIKLYHQAHEQRPLDSDTADRLFNLQHNMEDYDSIDKRLGQLKLQFGDCRTVLTYHGNWHSDDEVKLDNWRLLCQLNPLEPDIKRIYIKHLVSQRQLDEALGGAQSLIAQFPEVSANYCTLAAVELERDQRNKASEAARKALALDIDNIDAYGLLMAACIGPDDNKQAFEYIRQQMDKQQSKGEGLWQFWCYAKQWLEFEDQQHFCEQLMQRHQALSVSWTIYAQFLRDQGDLTLAVEKLMTAIAKFPLIPQFYNDLAQIHFLLRDTDKAQSYYLQALQLDPNWSTPAKELAIIYEGEQKIEQAIEVINRASQIDHHDGILLGLLADLQYKSGDVTAAMQNLQSAITKQMNYDWAWRTLEIWGNEQGNPRARRDLAAKLCEQMPHLPICWINRALESDIESEIVDYLNKALTLSPHNIQARSNLIDFYLDQGAFEQAQKQVTDKVWNGNPPEEIQLRGADIMADQHHYVEACQQVENIVEKYPRAEGGWRRLGYWKAQLGQTSAAMSAFEQLVISTPHNAYNLWISAKTVFNMHSDEKQKQVASQWLELAFWLEPAEASISLSWFDCLMSQGRHDELEKVIKVLDKRLDSPYYLSRKIEFDCATNNGNKSTVWFEQLLDCGELDFELYRAPASALLKTLHCDQVVQILERHMAEKSCTPSVAYLWALVVLMQKTGPKRIEQQLIKDPDNEHWMPICLAFIEHYIGLRTKLPSKFVSKHLKKIKADSALFGAYGELFFACGKNKKGMSWLNSKPLDNEWSVNALYPYYFTLFDVGKIDKSHAVLQLIKEKDPGQLKDSVTLLLIQETFIHDKVLDSEGVKSVDIEQLNDIEVAIYRLLSALTRLDGHSVEDKWDEIRPLLKEAKRFNARLANIKMVKRARTYALAYLLSKIGSAGLFARLYRRFRIERWF